MKTAAAVVCLFIFTSFQAMAAGTVLINGKEVKSREDIHLVLAKQLNFPKSYGKSLDSLYYMLITDLGNQTIVKIKHLSILKSKLGAEYTEALIQSISDASQDNPKVALLIE